MSTNIRPELSKKSKYWIPKHRYYELKHFVQQFPEWKEYMLSTDSMVKTRIDGIHRQNKRVPDSDPVWETVKIRDKYRKWIDLCHNVAEKTDDKLGPAIWHSIIHDESYDQVNARQQLPCSKDTWYDLYHKFFFLLDKYRA